MSVSVVLADDHPVVREGVKAILSLRPGIEIVGEASNGVETVEAVEELQPEVLVLDLMMPDFPGLEVIKSVVGRSPGTKIVVLSIHAEDAYVFQALKNGALGYVVKNAGTKYLTKAIMHAADGRRYLSPPLSLDVLETYGVGLESEDLDPYETLSSRERQVLRLASGGYTNKQIGSRLSISNRTVAVYRANLMHKLRLRSQAELIRYAIRRESSPSP